ncbi:MAG TPA: acyl-CoA dehydrogenase [Gammaproteobacteria bacterium]|nr:acyl-CoA dehydrogenase [Gammaproteobacteria bacterium]
MFIVLWIAALALGLAALAYWRMGMLWVALGGGVYLAVSAAMKPVPVSLLVLAAIPYLLIALPLAIVPLRRALISRRLLALFKKALPPLSTTEREALEAGSVWWDGELFSGRPDWEKLLTTPAPALTEEEQAFLDGPVEKLCQMVNDWDITQERLDLPPEVWRFIKENGFFGMIIPKEHGGLGFSALAHSAVVMKLASRSVSAAVTVMVPNSLGPAELLLHYGTEEQKNHYLPRLAAGEEVPCFALTGPEAGSDASSIPDRGVVCRGTFDGKEVLGIKLNWEKRYITLGPVATVLGLAFRLYDPDHLLGHQDDIGITLALIPTATAGVDIGERHFPLNQAFQNGPNRGRDVFIPLDWVIGGAQRVGQGWRMLMESLAAGRSISLPALSTGGGKLVCRATGAYARIRRQFRTPIGRFEGVEEALTRMAVHTYVMDAARVMTAGAVDRGEKPAVISAMVKYHLTERMRQAVNDAMDVQGGSAICMGPRNFIARMYQAIPISITVEGANILTRSLIIFGQGAVRCHPFVYKEMQAVNDSDAKRGLRDFDHAFFGHVGFTLSNAVRALWLGLTGARWARVPVTGALKRDYQHLTRLSAAFALSADIAMLVLGGALKRKEKLSGRFADVFSHLYLASAVLKRFEDQGRPEDDRPLVEWALADAKSTIEGRLTAIYRHLPQRWLGRALRWWVFPTGLSFQPADDRTGHYAAALLLSPSEARDRLTAGVFVPTDENEAVARLDRALALVGEAETVEKKLREAVRSGTLVATPLDALVSAGERAQVITAEEAALWRRFEALRREIIAVDAFKPEALI